MFKHKPCQAIMKISYQNSRLGFYPQTHTCPKCGAYIYISKIGLVHYFKQDGIQTSNPNEEFEEIENK